MVIHKDYYDMTKKKSQKKTNYNYIYMKPIVKKTTFKGVVNKNLKDTVRPN